MHDDLKQRLREEVDAELGSRPPRDLSDVLTRGRSKQLSLRLVTTMSMVLLGTALVAAGLWIAGARSLTSDDAGPVPPADKPSRTGSPMTIAEGSGEVRARAVMDLCEYLFPSGGCSDHLPGDRLLSVQLSANQEGGEVSGSGSIHGAGLDDSFTVRCSRYVDGVSLALGGTFDEGERAGKDIAVVIKDLDPDKLAIWFGKKDGCDSMLDDIEVRTWENLIYEPVSSGNFTLGGDG